MSPGLIVGPAGTLGRTGNPVMTCKGQYETALRNVVSGIRDRRFVAVDEERGIVFAFGFFDHSGGGPTLRGGGDDPTCLPR